MFVCETKKELSIVSNSTSKSVSSKHTASVFSSTISTSAKLSDFDPSASVHDSTSIDVTYVSYSASTEVNSFSVAASAIYAIKLKKNVHNVSQKITQSTEEIQFWAI